MCVCIQLCVYVCVHTTHGCVRVCMCVYVCVCACHALKCTAYWASCFATCVYALIGLAGTVCITMYIWYLAGIYVFFPQGFYQYNVSYLIRFLCNWFWPTLQHKRIHTLPMRKRTGTSQDTWLGLARTIYVRCINGIFSGKSPDKRCKHTVLANPTHGANQHFNELRWMCLHTHYISHCLSLPFWLN